MRKSLFVCGLVVALLSTSTLSQTEYEVAHQQEEIERQAIVTENLPLLDSEAEAFWDLYLEYRAADKEMDDQRVNLMLRLTESYEDLADDEGNRLVTDALRLEEERQSLKKRYFKKFARVLPGQRLLRYYQIETKLDAQKRYDWTLIIPLVPLSE